MKLCESDHFTEHSFSVEKDRILDRILKEITSKNKKQVTKSDEIVHKIFNLAKSIELFDERKLDAIDFEKIASLMQSIVHKIEENLANTLNTKLNDSEAKAANQEHKKWQPVEVIYLN